MNNFLINILKEKTNNKTIQKVVVEGDLTIFNAEQIKRKIENILKNKTPKVIQIQNVNAIDISFLQLIIALEKTLNQKLITNQFIWKIDFDKKNLLINCGYNFLNIN